MNDADSIHNTLNTKESIGGDMHLITEDVFFQTRDRFGGDGPLGREKFLMEQKHLFIDQKRLGRFSPELYERMIKCLE